MKDIERIYTHAHLFCGIGAGAKGFNQAQPRIGHLTGKFRCLGGIDVDAGAIDEFERQTGVKGTVLDLFNREQFEAFHGREPDADWREASPADLLAAFGSSTPDVVFTSAPCKGFSGLLSSSQSKTDKYQALNGLTLRGVWLMLEAYKDDPVPIVLFENVPRIASRGRFLLDQIIALLRSYGYNVNEDTHDCGELGGLAQSRKRFLLIARHPDKVPPFVYQPPKMRLRGVGEVIGHLPLPGDPVGGVMHRIPSLQWRTWVRLAFVPAGKDWRALNDLRVEDGVLADFGIVPDQPMRDNALGVMGWDETAGVVIGNQRSPLQGRNSVADPRPGPMHNDGLGVRSWQDPARVVASASRPGNGAHSVADPRPQQVNQTYAQYGVKAWEEPGATVSAQALPGGGPHSVADPRLHRVAHSNVYRVVSYADAATAVTSSRDVAVADPRPPKADYSSRKYKVHAYEDAARTVIGASTTGDGAFAVADPRGAEDASKLHGKYRVEQWKGEASRAVIAGRDNGAFAVADPRPALGTDGQREHYQTGGHYGVVDWDQTGYCVSGSARHDNGWNNVADPREADVAGEPAPLPEATDRLVCRIVAPDNTWHRPFTTLELASLQSIVDPEEVFGVDQDGAWFVREGFEIQTTSDATRREWIGNAVPSAAARAMATTIGEALILAGMGETFTLSSREIWVKPLALALAVDNDQQAWRMDR